MRHSAEDSFATTVLDADKIMTEVELEDSFATTVLDEDKVLTEVELEEGESGITD